MDPALPTCLLNLRCTSHDPTPTTKTNGARRARFTSASWQKRADGGESKSRSEFGRNTLRMEVEEEVLLTAVITIIITNIAIAAHTATAVAQPQPAAAAGEPSASTIVTEPAVREISHAAAAIPC